MKKIYTLLIVTALMSLACASDNKKPSADSIFYTEAVKTLNIIKEAYEKKNRAYLQNHLTSGLAEKVLENLSFEKAELNFTVRLARIIEKDSCISINLNWRGSWWFAGDQKLENSGVADLVLERETMKLIEVKGDNPFLIPDGGN